ncbi:MAG: Stp1/IreP family PP2C-type Ser/Thr phosphatase [Clostridia bacterium]|nr:Stp1/IreP family PP2C-type Ser/Thr phosphatase [Clostridia bacterium]
MRFGVKSDKGIVREVNEDSYNVLAGYSNVPVSFIIADGMGGHNSGEIASQTAVNYISNYIMENPSDFCEEGRISQAILQAVRNTNSRVYELSLANQENSGMGTTFILAVVCNKRLYIGHVGDSRVYLLRDGIIEQITTDHSYIEELVRTGSISREEAQNHPKKNLITRALGCGIDVEVDLYTCNIKENDIYLLCTDGLTNLVDENDIKQILESQDDPEEACGKLVELANSRGGDDNVTVIVFKNG